MNVFVLIFYDRDMRPRSDQFTTAVFSTREAAEAAMEDDISTTIENGQIEGTDMFYCPDCGYAESGDGRFIWKIEEKNLATVDRG